jgi:hypothetical protein
MKKNTKSNAVVKSLSKEVLAELETLALAYFNADEAFDKAKTSLADRVKQVVGKSKDKVDMATAYRQVEKLLLKAGYVKAYVQRILRDAGLRLRQSSGNDKRSGNGRKVALTPKASKALAYIATLKLNDADRKAIIANLA